MTIRPSRMTAMLSISDVVDLLGVSDKTIRRLIKAKKLSCHHVGRQVRFTEDQLSAFLATHGKQRLE